MNQLSSSYCHKPAFITGTVRPRLEAGGRFQRFLGLSPRGLQAGGDGTWEVAHLQAPPAMDLGRDPSTSLHPDPGVLGVVFMTASASVRVCARVCLLTSRWVRFPGTVEWTHVCMSPDCALSLGVRFCQVPEHRTWVLVCAPVSDCVCICVASGVSCLCDGMLFSLQGQERPGPAESLDLGRGEGRKAAFWISPASTSTPLPGVLSTFCRSSSAELKIAPGPLEAEGVEAHSRGGGGWRHPCPAGGP